MPINGKGFGGVDVALTTTNTVESAFRTALTDIATQVDANEIDINVTRSVALTGSVLGNVPIFNIGDNDSRNISIPTTIDTGMVGNDQLATDSVSNLKVANDAINTAEIVNSAVTTAKINDDAVTSAKINDGAVTLAHLSGTRTLTILPSGGGTPLFRIVGINP